MVIDPESSGPYVYLPFSARYTWRLFDKKKQPLQMIVKEMLTLDKMDGEKPIFKMAEGIISQFYEQLVLTTSDKQDHVSALRDISHHMQSCQSKCLVLSRFTGKKCNEPCEFDIKSTAKNGVQTVVIKTKVAKVLYHLCMLC